MFNIDDFDVSFKQIFIVFISFVFGIFSILILQNAVKSEITSFTTVDLISFLFSIALSSISIFLAITAIILSKSSEKTIIDRNDAGINLQQDIHLKTLETLKQIEVSTGVTEKRIDDIFLNILKKNLPKDIQPEINSIDETD